MRAKFDKLANTRKPTRGPTCPRDVRRAKNIAKSMLAKSSVAVAGIVEEDDDVEEGTSKERKRSILFSPNKRASCTGDPNDRSRMRMVRRLSSTLARCLKRS